MFTFFAFLLGVLIGGFIGLGLSIPFVKEYLEDERAREDQRLKDNIGNSFNDD